MRYVPAGSFQRDATATNVSVITKGYWLAETETTQELFLAVMESNPSNFDGTSGKEAAAGETQNKRPVEYVNWYHAIAFCNKLSVANNKQAVYRVNGISDWAALQYSAIPTTDNSGWNAVTMDTSKNGYRLPTEMEWMWAAMGADKTSQPNTTGYAKAFAGSNGTNSIGDYAWHGNSSGNTDGNSDSKTHEVGKKTANELGLKDMNGNVWEWCWDWHGSYPADEKTDFTGAASGSKRVIRGGSFGNYASPHCTVAFRLDLSPTYQNSALGFRFACPAQQ
jgi:formylglycine-generating enzyme required for sulfatase activity